MDYRLLQRRNRLRDRGIECWLVAIYAAGVDPADSGATPVLALTSYYDDITYDGVTYTGYNLKLDEPPGADSEGLPTGSLTVSNVTLEFQTSLSANDYYRGGTCVFTPYNTAESVVDYSSDQKQLEIINHETTLKDVKFILSVPKQLIEVVPEDLCSPYSCRHKFRYARCGYAPVDIQAITLSGSDPISIQATGHGMSTGDYVLVETVTEISPDLNEVFVITRTDDDNFTLDDTDSSDYSGTYTSGGKAGFAYCDWTRPNCSDRGRLESFGAMPGLRPDSIMIGI